MITLCWLQGKIQNGKPEFEANMSTPLITAADSPTNLLAMQASSTSIRISWTAPTSGATVTGYQINYQSEREEGSVNVGASEATVTLDGRSRGLTYNISILALSQQLPSPLAGPVTVTLGESLDCNVISWLHPVTKA